MSNTQTKTRRNVPQHVGLIPDGNRRWARQQGLDLEPAYRQAMEKVVTCLSAFYDSAVLSVCVYLLSKDNVLRARDDLTAVIQAELWLLQELIPNVKRAYSLRVYHAGNPDLLPVAYRCALEDVCELGNGRDDPFPRLYLCAGYDPEEELVRSGICAATPPHSLVASLSVPLELDMVIRTGGDVRISGFLPLQSKYAELFFEPYFFPEITRDRISILLDEFQRRDRRFGK